MKLINKNMFIILTTIITLSACGGGADEGTKQTNNSNSSNVNNGDSATITGQFLSSHDTGKFYSTEGMPSYQQYGKNAKHCYQNYNDYYFETDKTMVFGNQNLPESDFKQAASWVETNLNSALIAMGISESEYFNARYRVRLAGLKHIRNRLNYKEYDSFTYPNEFDNWNNEQQVDWATKTAKSINSEEAVNLLINDPYSPYQTASEAVLEDKIYVCLHENSNPYGWGEGNLVGITIGAASITVPNDVDKLIQHELIHTIQQALTANFEEFGLPRWFSEGQAVALSGMNIANKTNHNEYDPTLVVSYYDEYGDPSSAYEHYGLAYQYLKDANGQSVILKMMKDIKILTYDYSSQLNSELNEYHGYVEVFDAQMKQSNGNHLSVKEYRDNYHSIMSEY
jgi:hypothetical protein